MTVTLVAMSVPMQSVIGEEFKFFSGVFARTHCIPGSMLHIDWPPKSPPDMNPIENSQVAPRTRSAASTSSTKSSPGDRKTSTTSNQHLAAINIQKLYNRGENNEGLPLGWAETCGVTCCEELVVEPPSNAYKLKAALNVVKLYHEANVAERSTEYKAGKLNEPKEGSPKILTMVFDPTLRELITSSWRAAAASAKNFDGYGNLPTVAKLYVQWAPYLRPRGEASLLEEGMQVPLDSELCKKARL